MAFFILILATLFLIVYPVWRVIFYPSLEDYLAFPQNARWLKALTNSMVMMVLSMITCSTLAFLFSYSIVRLRIKGKALFRFITLLPIVSPPFIVALSYILLFGRQGLITNHLLGVRLNIYGWQGLWAVQTISFFPYAYAVIEGVMRNIPENMEYAARNLGAGKWRAFWDVFFPLCRPGVAGGAMIAAISVLADFGNPSMIAGNFHLLPIEAYMQMVGWYNMTGAAVLSTVLLIPTFAIFLLNRYWLGSRAYTTTSGKESFLPPQSLPKLVEWTVFSICLIVSIFVLLVYGVLLVGAFSKTWGYDWSLDLSNFAQIYQKRKLLFNSLEYAAISSVLASSAGFALAFLVERVKLPGKKILDFLAVLPGAVPGIFLGLGFALALGPPPFALTGTPTIMIVALSIWNIPTCYNANRARLQQISDSIEQAARNLGASKCKVVSGIFFPILKRTILSSLMLSFLRSMTCLSVVIFIYGVSTTVSTISVLSLVNSGDWSGAAAFTSVIITVAFTSMGIFKLAERIFSIVSGDKHGRSTY
jgi:iron(III) transport system permease protein